MTDLNPRCQPRALLPALLLVLALAPPAHADVVDSVNGVRASGCGNGPKGLAPLQQNHRLDEVAHRVAGGDSLSTAQRRVGYHALSSFSVSISDVPESGEVRAIIERQFCPQSTNPAFTEIGVWREGTQIWLAFAQPFTPPAAPDRTLISARVLELVNAARAAARRCGSAPYPAAPPLTRNAILERVAQDFAQDMATFGYMDHTGRDGSAPHERVTRGGYRWSETGENLASGVTNADVLVDGWLHSPEHCANLMDPAYTQMGVAFAVNPRNAAGIYWAMELGRPAGK